MERIYKRRRRGVEARVANEFSLSNCLRFRNTSTRRNWNKRGSLHSLLTDLCVSSSARRTHSRFLRRSSATATSVYAQHRAEKRAMINALRMRVAFIVRFSYRDMIVFFYRFSIFSNRIIKRILIILKRGEERNSSVF